MSLIAYTNNYGTPILIGDILFSTEDKLKELPIPTKTVEVTQYLNKETWFPYKLMQKAYILRENVCITMAGDYKEMKEFLTAFSIYLINLPIVKARDIANFLHNYNIQSKYNNSAFYILHLSIENDKPVFKPFKFPEETWRNEVNNVFTNVYANGDGKAVGDFLRQIKDIGKYITHAEKSSHNYALKANINLIVKLLAAERVTLFTLMENWGAGFEIIYNQNGTFKKLDDLTYIIFEGSIEKGGHIGEPEPKLFLHYKYVSGFLIINSVEIHECLINQNAAIIKYTSTKFSQKVFNVPPIEFKSSFTRPIIDIKDTCLNTNRVAIGYALSYKKVDKGVYTPTYFNNDENMYLRFVPNQIIELVINRMATEAVRKGVKDIYPKL